MEKTIEVSVRDINSILEAISRIEKQVELINQGKTHVKTSGVLRLDIIKEKALLIRSLVKQM